MEIDGEFFMEVLGVSRADELLAIIAGLLWILSMHGANDVRRVGVPCPLSMLVEGRKEKMCEENHFAYLTCDGACQHVSITNYLSYLA